MSATTDGTLFLNVEGRNGSRPAFRQLVNGDYSEYQFFEPAEYFMERDAHLVVDPEGDYVIFDSQSRPRIGECMLFVTFRRPDGRWTKPVSMGEYIEQEAAIAWISYDGKYIFYKAGDDVYGVSAEVVEELRPVETWAKRVIRFGDLETCCDIESPNAILDPTATRPYRYFGHLDIVMRFGFVSMLTCRTSQLCGGDASSAPATCSVK